MKKTLISVAVLSIMTAPLSITSAQAQNSSTSLYGALDNGIRWSNKAGQDHLGNTKQSRTSINTGGLSGSHLGFKGQENLGQGALTFFKLEAGINLNTGESNSSSDSKIYGKKTESKSLFGRQAYLGLGHQALGYLTMGRQYTVSYDAVKDFDPSNNISQHQAIHYLSGYADLKNNHNRSDATFKYTHQLNQVTTLASYKPGNQVGSMTHGSEFAMGLKYKNSMWGVGASMTEIGVSKMQDTAHTHHQSLGKTRIINLAGEYKIDRLKLKAGISRTSIPAMTSGAVLKHPQLMIPQKDQVASFLTVAAWGVQYDLTHQVALNLSHYAQLHQQRQGDVLLGKDKRTVMSAIYQLSKRTDLYGLLEWHSNRAGVSENNKSKNQQSVTAGLRHRF